MKKKRADQLLYEHGHCDSIEQASLLILEGKVRSKADALVRKSSELFDLWGRTESDTTEAT